MSEPAPSVPPNHDPLRTLRNVHLLCYALLGLVFLYVIIARYALPLIFDDTVGIEPARVRQVEQRIDPNTASWAELARLPGIGEVLAKRIVAYRDQRRAALGPDGPSAVVFSSPEDLGAVPGIGDGKIERFADCLKLPRTP